MKRYRLVPAYPPFSWFLKRYGYSAITMPWRSIYFYPASGIQNRKLRKHELVHIAQMRRDGTIKFVILYLWWNVKYGYWNNPYEIEARRITGN